MSQIKEFIRAKKNALLNLSDDALQALAKQCSVYWDDPDKLDATLHDGIQILPHCKMIYAVNTDGILISSNIECNKMDSQWSGLDLTSRPYLGNGFPNESHAVSNVYTSRLTTEPTLTLMQPVKRGQQYVGFIAADFSVDELPNAGSPIKPVFNRWQQYKGDPAIRGTLFMQERVLSAMDKVLEEVIIIITELMQHQGIFHTKIHFSSSRASFWSVDDPYDYQIHTVEDITDPDVCLAYPRQPLFSRAQVNEEDIASVLRMFMTLRNADDTVYLRSSSFNIVNGMVGLTFSCDGSHYLHYKEFLDKGKEFWFGQASEVISA